MMRGEVNKVRLTVLIALLFSTLCAGVFRTPPILFMAALLWSAPAVSFIVSRISSRSLRIERHLPEVGTIGDVITGELTLKNTARLPVFLANARAGQKAGAFISIGDDGYVAPTLRGHSQTTWNHQWILQQRGIHKLAPAEAGVLDPLGLSTVLPIKSEPAKIVVLPRPLKLSQLGLWGGIGANNRTPRHSTTVADAMDFHGVKAWQPGETIRRAHWKTTARTGQLHVVEWEETPGTDLALLLDTQAAMIGGSGERSTLEAAITAAASIAVHLLEGGFRVELFYYESVANAQQRSTPLLQLRHLKGKNVASSGAILRALAEVEAVADSSATLMNLVQNAIPQIARGMGGVLLSSSRSEFAGAMQRAQARRGEVSYRGLIFDAASYDAASDETFDSKNVKPDIRKVSGTRREKTPGVRTAYHGDSLGALLESDW